jgi:hypothetical protein
MSLIVKDQRNTDVLFPYLNGQDLNSRADITASRWVINFHDWPIDKARTYPEVFAIVETEVRPERQRRKPDGTYALRNPLPTRYWHYADKRPAMISATMGLERVIAITLHTKFVTPATVSNRQVFSHGLGVFATDDMAMLALLSSAPHYWWAITCGSTLETRIRYTPSDVFDTFPRPVPSSELLELGIRIDTHRREVMLARQAGLTKMYNMLHDPGCQNEDIVELREIHRLIDDAVVRAYGWDDLLE